MSQTVIIIDYGMGNVGSIANMLRKVGATSEVSSDPDRVAGAERLILPGVGAFDAAIERLAELELVEVLNKAVLEQHVPLLGICLGLQLFADSSEEGGAPGLGWIPGTVERLPGTSADGQLPLPHMGWSRLTAAKPSPVIDALDDQSRFYFVHSFAIRPTDPSDILTTSTYGTEFVSAVQRGNITGVQFHPEKSHRHGKALLAAWLDA